VAVAVAELAETTAVKLLLLAVVVAVAYIWAGLFQQVTQSLVLVVAQQMALVEKQCTVA
jgi:hypothetical protein